MLINRFSHYFNKYVITTNNIVSTCMPGGIQRVVHKVVQRHKILPREVWYVKLYTTQHDAKVVMSSVAATGVSQHLGITVKTNAP